MERHGAVPMNPPVRPNGGIQRTGSAALGTTVKQLVQMVLREGMLCRVLTYLDRLGRGWVGGGSRYNISMGLTGATRGQPLGAVHCPVSYFCQSELELPNLLRVRALGETAIGWSVVRLKANKDKGAAKIGIWPHLGTLCRS